jgi:CheY-like chemotaxis protein
MMRESQAQLGKGHPMSDLRQQAGASRRICVIDDDELVREHVSALLGSEGYQVTEAADARAGLVLIDQTRPQAVLVDIIMPDKDGVELIAEIRRRWPSLKVVAMSGGGRVGPSLYLQIAEKMGADACLKKPLTLADLTAALQ